MKRCRYIQKIKLSIRKVFLFQNKMSLVNKQQTMHSNMTKSVILSDHQLIRVVPDTLRDSDGWYGSGPWTQLQQRVDGQQLSHSKLTYMLFVVWIGDCFAEKASPGATQSIFDWFLSVMMKLQWHSVCSNTLFKLCFSLYCIPLSAKLFSINFMNSRFIIFRLIGHAPELYNITHCYLAHSGLG